MYFGISLFIVSQGFLHLNFPVLLILGGGVVKKP